MDKIDFQYGGGFPLKTDTLAFMQGAIFAGLSAIAKNLSNSQKVILSGCDITGESGMSAGFVIIQNEVLPIDAGNLYNDTGYRIVESASNDQFKDGSIHPIYFTRKVELVNTNPTNNFNADFIRLPSIFNLPKIRQGSEYYAANSLEGAADRTITGKSFTGDYVVLGSFRGLNNANINANYSTYCTYSHTANSFKLSILSMTNGSHPEFYFDYVVIKV